MLFLIIFVFVPLIEVALFASVGDEIGLLNTLALCVLTALVGSYLVRAQGLMTLFALNDAMDRGVLPVQELFDGFCLVLAGILLITPGFFTDTVGFLLLIPQVRAGLRHYAGAWLARRGLRGDGLNGGENAPPSSWRALDAEYERVDDSDAIDTDGRRD